MTQPNSNDLSAVGGAHPGTKSQEEMANQISFDIDNKKSLSEAASRVMSAADWHLNSFADPNRSPKYCVDPEVSYYGAGSLSLIPRLGQFIFSANTNEANRGAFRMDHGESNFYSNLNNTTLGSLNIDTVDGHILNPQSPQQPSTNYNPVKPWIKKLFPTLSSKNVMTMAILGLIQKTLLDIIDRSRGPSENNDRKRSVDMASIIIDNQETEDELLGLN